MGLTTRSLLAPDERTWLLWGRDPRAEGHRPVTFPAGADVLACSRWIPEALAPALRALWSEMPSRRRLVLLDSPLSAGVEAAHVLAGHEHHTGHGEHGDGHGEHGDGHEGHGDGHEGHGDGHEGHGDGHDHAAMMAVTGDPSPDGLVMENLEVVLGPVSSVLPTGVIGRFDLDGDVVCGAELSAVLIRAGSVAPDPTAAAAWRAAVTAAAGSDVSWIVEVELERALSHATWFMTLGDVLGWPQLGAWARDAALALLAVQLTEDAGPAALDAADAAAARLASLLEGSRRLRHRLAGVGSVSAADAERLDLAGPNARASGIAADARTDHPSYVALGFRPVVREQGDAEARAQVRLAELVASIALAQAALDDPTRTAPSPAAEVEAPRGAVAVVPASPGEAPVFVARGAEGALRAAGEAAAGQEWPVAVAAVASFDLSGWRVP